MITLDGSVTMTIEVGTTWVEPGYTAIDNFDGDISNNVEITGFVDVSNIGVYILNYDVSDNAGNVASQVTRTVNVNILLIENVYKIRLEQSSNYIHIVEFMALNGTSNVSQGKTASQSSNYNSTTTANRVTNNVLTGDDWVYGNHTNNSSSEWVEVNFGASYTITELRIYIYTFTTPDDYHAITLNGATVKMLNNSNNVLWSSPYPTYNSTDYNSKLKTPYSNVHYIEVFKST